MSKKKLNRKGGWTLMELCVAMIILAILVGLAIQSIKPKKVMYIPFAYAGYHNLKQATNYIINKCYNDDPNYQEKIYGCQKGTYKLPVTDDSAVSAINADIDRNNSDPNSTTTDAHVSLSSMPEVFCYEVANLFTLVNDGAVNCGQGQSKNTIHTSLPKGNGRGNDATSSNVAGVPNFQASNMVAYYFLEGPWLPINRAQAEENNLTGTKESQFKPIFIDINGNDGPNRLGEDQFPLRLYIDGTITPGSCHLYGEADTSGTSTNSGEKMPDVTYPDRLYCPESSRYSEVTNESWLESKYPFSYNLLHSYIAEGGNNTDRTTEILLRGLSYQEAACKSGRDIVVPRGPFCSNDGSTKEDNPGAKNLNLLTTCERGSNDSLCLGRMARPSGPGLFRLPMM